MKSKNIKKTIIIISVISLVVTIILAFGSEILYTNYNSSKEITKNFTEINISEYRIKDVFNKRIKNRKTKSIAHKVFVGETVKQIENGYYDLKAYIQDNKCIVICLNKLWKQFDKKLYEEDYMIEIAESIKDILAINVPQNQIYDYILSGYLVAKSSDNNDNKEYVLNLEDYVIKGKILEKEFVMSIYKK